MDYLVTAYYTDGTIHKWGEDDLNEAKDTFNYVIRNTQGYLMEQDLL